MRAADALRLAIPRLRAAGVADAPGDGRRLLAHAMGLAPDRLTLHLPDEMTGAQGGAFEAALLARMARQPVSQIIGSRAFFGLSFRVTPDVLDPRPETELLVEAALARSFVNMLDLGTGTGCVLLSCLAGMKTARGLGTDLSPAALAVAEGNAVALGLEARARFQLSDWYGAVEGRFDLITSNPPYITEAEMAALAPEVRDWEPHLALTPGGDGLASYRAIATGAGARLMAGGRILLEIGPTQAAAVSALLRAEGFGAIEVMRDLDGRDRVVAAKMPGEPGHCGTA